MADLNEVAKSLKVEISSKSIKDKEFGKRRRSWLTDDEENITAPAVSAAKSSASLETKMTTNASIDIAKPAPIQAEALKPKAIQQPTVHHNSLPPRRPSEQPSVKQVEIVWEAYVWPKAK